MNVNPQEGQPPAVIRWGQWKGMDNRLHAKSVPDDYVRNAVNVIFDNSGRIASREGLTKVFAGSGLHSGFSCEVGVFFVEGSTLKKLNSDFTATTVRTGIDGTVAYCCANDASGELAVYCSDASNTWRISPAGAETFWGVPVPAAPALSAAPSSGSLDPGTYTVFLTGVKSSEESGASATSTITVNGGGIEVAPSSVTTADYYRVYMTGANGTGFHYQTTVNRAPVTLTSFSASGRSLIHESYSPPPVGSIIRFFHGRIFVASGQQLFYSAPYQMGRFHQAEQYLYFPADITVVEPVDDGLWIVADKTYFMAGGDPAQATVQLIVHDTAVIGTSIIDAGVAYWMSASGAFMAKAGGQYEYMNMDHIAVSSGAEGASMFMERDGNRLFFSTFTPQGSASLQSTDWAASEAARKA